MLRPIFLFSLSAVSSTYAQFTLTSDGCVDASGFNSCMSQVTTQVQQCVQNNCQGGGTCEDFNNCQSSDANCYPACLCGGYQAWINCAASHCWNKGYSCEYQNYVIDAVKACDAALAIQYPPYFIAPAGQPGGCSCQIGVIFGIIQEMQSNINKCTKLGSTGAHYTDCQCCGASKALSSLTDVCPTSDLSSILSLFSNMQNYQSAGSILKSSACTNAFSQGLDCTASDFAFQQYNSSQFYDWADLPSFGSAPVSDLPGTGLPEPSAATVTWAFYSGGPIATAVAVQGSGSEPSGSGSSASVSVSRSTTVFSSAGTSGAGTASATSTKTSSAQSRVFGRRRPTIFAAVMGLAASLVF